jgi:hypothetical protein
MDREKKAGVERQMNSSPIPQMNADDSDWYSGITE